MTINTDQYQPSASHGTQTLAACLTHPQPQTASGVDSLALYTTTSDVGLPISFALLLLTKTEFGRCCMTHKKKNCVLTIHEMT